MVKLIDTCKLDKLGRVVIPMNICKAMGLTPDTLLNIILHGNEFIVEKHIPNVSRHQKAIGMIRKMDCLDRFVIPKELLNEMEITRGQMFIVKLTDETIKIKAYDEAI